MSQGNGHQNGANGNGKNGHENGNGKSAEKQNGCANKPQLFKPGQSGNPGGRPKAVVSLTAAIRSELSKPGKTGRSKAHELADHMIEMAQGTDKTAAAFAKIVCDRADPKEIKIEVGQHVGFTRDEISTAGRMLWGHEAVASANLAGHG